MASIDVTDDFHDNDLEDEEEAEEFPPLPPMPSLSPRRDDDDETDRFVSQALKDSGTDAVEAALEDIPTARATRVVNRKPQPKLDASRLIDPERGIPVIQKQFSKLKFKGKGHECADLRVLMNAYEHWAHRLFPKMRFDDVIEKVEQLGHKKPVQTTLTKIRLDIPLTDDDFVLRGAEAEEEAEGEGEDTELASLVQRNTPQPPPSQTQDDDAINQLSQPALSTPLPMTTITSPGSQNIKKGTLTDEQVERIERNKRLARERRASKMKADVSVTASQDVAVMASQDAMPTNTSSQQSLTMETNDNMKNNVSKDQNEIVEDIEVEKAAPKTAENLDVESETDKTKVDVTEQQSDKEDDVTEQATDKEEDSDDDMGGLVIDESGKAVENAHHIDSENDVAMEVEETDTNITVPQQKEIPNIDSEKNKVDEMMDVENNDDESKVSNSVTMVTEK